ncbi:copper resistance protein B [Allosphingosinicella indica]|uniref:Copper resistance protein B n=1 Tax=Allosphingosinicella indica TaxID=941907 RepID=A0A1X7FZ71_9SPHN|nr:copper resistance protein B [Allosphingosinicella indica]SMF61420.1 copper resistance protein B [Allosphingosinicella indica]
MIRLAALLLAATAAPAFAQHAGHEGHAMPAPAPAPAPADPHAGHETPAADPHAGHTMPAADPHAGHGMPADDAPPVAPPPAEALSGPEHAADTVFGSRAMEGSRYTLRREHGGMRTGRILIDRAEFRIRNGRDGYAVEGDAWYGGDYDKLWLKTEVEGSFGEKIESAELQALWSRPIKPFFDLQAGVRYDVQPDPETAHLVLGIQGLAPYWFEVDGALFLSHRGDVTARIEAEYDQRITQNLTLQPAIEFDLAAQDVPEIGVGRGISTVEAGLRLRYEFVPEFAPYVGVNYERALGRTADFRRLAGEDPGGWNLVLGIRAWF